MANLIINRTREVEVGTETFVKGMWKLEVVCPNGEIKKPFGDGWRPNLLMRRGLQQLVGGLDGFSSIAYLMNTAQYGNVVTSPTDRTFNGGLVNSTAYPSITNDTQLGIFGFSAFSSVGAAGNIITDNLNTGSRTFQKTYDFLATPNQQTVREIIITDYRDPNNPTVRGTGRADSDMLSRFILPSPVVLAQYQFLRLTYALQITIPAITAAGEVNIDVQSGSFNGLGKLRCVGSFNQIFGSMTTNGEPIDTLFRSAFCGNITKRNPWCLVSSFRTHATLVPGGDLSGTAQMAFPAVNTDVNASIAAQTSAASVQSDGAGGSVIDLGLSNGNLSWTRGATLLFPATNPNLPDQYIGGVFFTPGASTGSSCNTALSTGFDFSGWYWRFVDLSGNPRGQLKDINFALAINVAHTASIT